MTPPKTLTILVPVFNEEQVLPTFMDTLRSKLVDLPPHVYWTVLFVNDGSSDRTGTILREISADDPRAGYLTLSRNFGKELAVTAGLDVIDSDAVVLIDADLQDPPELIIRFVKHWLEDGYNVVYGKRRHRSGESWFRRTTAFLFYRTMQQVSNIHIPEDTGDFRLLDRKAVEELKRLREHHRYMKGLFAWIGLRQLSVEFDRNPRLAGDSKWNYWRLWNFAIEGITGFTTLPLTLIVYFGTLVALLSFIYAGWIVLKTLIWGDPVSGYPSMMTAILFLGGAQLIALGVLGQYMARIHTEVKHRPLYIVSEAVRPAAQVKEPT